MAGCERTQLRSWLAVNVHMLHWLLLTSATNTHRFVQPLVLLSKPPMSLPSLIQRSLYFSTKVNSYFINVTNAHPFDSPFVCGFSYKVFLHCSCKHCYKTSELYNILFLVEFMWNLNWKGVTRMLCCFLKKYESCHTEKLTEIWNWT